MILMGPLQSILSVAFLEEIVKLHSKKWLKTLETVITADNISVSEQICFFSMIL